MRFSIDSQDHKAVDKETGVVPPAADAAELKANLEAARDEWLSTEPQMTNRGTPTDTDKDANGNPKYKDRLDELDNLIAKNRNEARAPYVKERAKAIRDLASAGLDSTHTAIKSLMDAAIAYAVAEATRRGCPVRVTIAGHYKPKNKDGVHNRLRVDIDDAVHG